MTNRVTSMNMRIHTPSPVPSIQSWGVCCFLKVARRRGWGRKSYLFLDAFYSFKKVWLFHCSPPHSFQSEKYSLTSDGNCEKFSVLLQLSFHIVVDMRQGESNIFQFQTWKAFFLKCIFYENPTNFGKPVETGVDPCLSNCPQWWISNNYPTSGWICWHVIVEVELFYFMDFLNFLRWKSKSWKTTVWDSNDGNKTGMGFALMLL